MAAGVAAGIGGAGHDGSGSLSSNNGDADSVAGVGGAGYEGAGFGGAGFGGAGFGGAGFGSAGMPPVPALPPAADDLYARQDVAPRVLPDNGGGSLEQLRQVKCASELSLTRQNVYLARCFWHCRALRLQVLLACESSQNLVLACALGYNSAAKKCKASQRAAYVVKCNVHTAYGSCFCSSLCILLQSFLSSFLHSFFLMLQHTLT